MSATILYVNTFPDCRIESMTLYGIRRYAAARGWSVAPADQGTKRPIPGHGVSPIRCRAVASPAKPHGKRCAFRLSSQVTPQASCGGDRPCDAGRFIVYALRNSEKNPHNREDHFGIVHADFSPKPAFLALRDRNP